MRRLLALILLVTTGLVWLGSSPAAACEPSPYSPDSCGQPTLSIAGDREVARSARATVVVSVKTRGALQVHGVITMTVTHARTGWTSEQTRTLRHNHARLRTPRLDAPGTYRILIEFEPTDDGPWLPTSRTSTLRVTRR
ncbi:hypothetical protein ASC77_08030 [Nocardioides sp. Root1257]|uniref:hypothetical protein n=1 Tax=unclassified Nocardioides TaxID=2615069 RepID=UPI00070187F2|nr:MULTISPECIES: hypothetical protein [unclassified Nocardioides]KQW48676.1 hypothetical protein ASC77_08030 [Nocardioides sp. Root1257]KRC47851.1 hypothetical protein ASE24_08035 [Nocardioides sp. Root224]